MLQIWDQLRWITKYRAHLGYCIRNEMKEELKVRRTVA